MQTALKTVAATERRRFLLKNGLSVQQKTCLIPLKIKFLRSEFESAVLVSGFGRFLCFLPLLEGKYK